MSKKQLKGIIVSDKMQKTVVVSVESNKKDLKYKRRYKVHKKYKAHNEKEECKVGDMVVIEECRPISRDKKWKVINKNNQTTNKLKNTAQIKDQPTIKSKK